jgi:Arc/MetJ family transcription regulator
MGWRFVDTHPYGILYTLGPGVRTMRTNIVLDEELVEQAKSLTGIKTTRALVDQALRVLIQLRQQEQVRDLRGGLNWEGDLAALREGRVRYEADEESDTRDAGG